MCYFASGSFLYVLAVIPETPAVSTALPKGIYSEILQVFVTGAMLVACINTFPPKPMKTTETNCCNALPRAPRARLWYLESARPQGPGPSCLMFDNIRADSATKRRWDKLPALEMPPVGVFGAVSPSALPPDHCFTPSSVHLSL